MSSEQATGIRKSIFILKSNPMTLQAAENFLKARDWEVISSVSLKDAITTILTKNPEYFLICANHPHKKVKQLPKVLASAFTVKMLVYVDIASTLNMSLMQEFGIKAQILPPVSGPAIERAIFKYEKEELQKREESARMSSEDMGAYSITKPLNSEDARQRLSQFMNSSNENESDEGSSIISSGGAEGNSGPYSTGSSGSKDPNTIYTNSKDTTGPRGQSYMPGSGGSGPKGPAYMPTGHGDGSGNQVPGGYIPSEPGSSSFAGGGQSQANGPSAIQGSAVGSSSDPSAINGGQGSSAVGNQGGFAPHDPHSNETFAEYEERMRREREGQINSKQPHVNIEESKKSHFMIQKPGTKNQNFATGNSKVEEENNQSGKSVLKFNNKKKFNSESIIVKGTQHALESATVKSTKKNEPIEKLSINQNCLCIVIDSTRFQGYLIAALGKNRRFDDEFMKNIQVRLFEFLKKQGENVDDENALEIKIKPVEFEGWALEQAEFLRKSVHNGDEVAMAFFPTQKTGPEISESAKEDMVSINIDDLEGDIQVLFDVYIYLPTNQKYILYTPKGSTFFANQKDRLKVKGINQMHMKKNEIQEAKKYSAQNYLNNKIDEYEQKAQEQQQNQQNKTQEPNKKKPA